MEFFTEKIKAFLSHSNHFTEDYRDTNGLINDANNTEISQRHWQQVKNRTHCYNQSCLKKFSSDALRCRHHCRRCGEVFCQKCVQYYLPLNRLAQLDLDGEMHQVCKNCFEHGKLTCGQTRNLTRVFEYLRASQHGDSKTDHLNFEKECQRLINGFKLNAVISEAKQTFHQVKNWVSTPEWMKSTIWTRENRKSSCHICMKMFIFSKIKTFCHVCGRLVCESCSTKDLLLYIPDEEKEKMKNYQPKMAIIKVMGCPEKEPVICIYLRVCPHCKGSLESRQFIGYQLEINKSSHHTEFLDHLQRIERKFKEAEKSVKIHLPKYRQIVDSLQDNQARTDSHNNMTTLAKVQEDLADALAQHVTTVIHMKKLKPQTDIQKILHERYIRAKCNFYLDNMSIFRKVKHKLSEIVGEEILNIIQTTMDENSIISTHVYLRQLVYETIIVCDAHKLPDDLPTILMKLEGTIESDVNSLLKQKGRNIEFHMDSVKEMVRTLLKEKKLISLSKSQIDRKGSTFVNEQMLHGVMRILHRVTNQLRLRTADSSFQLSKNALEKTIEELQEWKSKLQSEAEEFVFVDKAA